MKSYPSFTHNGWNCWFNDTVGTWGAILSRAGRQPLIMDTPLGGKKERPRRLCCWRNTTDAKMSVIDITPTDDGTFTEFDDPNVGTGAGSGSQGTLSLGINPAGESFGSVHRPELCFFMAICALPTAPSPRLMFLVRALAPIRAPHIKL